MPEYPLEKFNTTLNSGTLYLCCNNIPKSLCFLTVLNVTKTIPTPLLIEIKPVCFQCNILLLVGTIILSSQPLYQHVTHKNTVNSYIHWTPLIHIPDSLAPHVNNNLIMSLYIQHTHTQYTRNVQLTFTLSNSNLHTHTHYNISPKQCNSATNSQTDRYPENPNTPVYVSSIKTLLRHKSPAPP